MSAFVNEALRTMRDDLLPFESIQKSFVSYVRDFTSLVTFMRLFGFGHLCSERERCNVPSCVRPGPFRSPLQPPKKFYLETLSFSNTFSIRHLFRLYNMLKV
jgi:hypothetical protein